MKNLKIFPILTVTRSGQSLWLIYSCLNIISKYINFDLLFIDCFNNYLWSIHRFKKTYHSTGEILKITKINKII